MHSTSHPGELRRRASWLSSTVLVLLAAAAGDAQAQTLDPPLAPGARIRVLSPLLGPGPHIGEVDRVVSDSIVFRPQGEGDVRSIPFPDIQELWISGGARPKSHRVAKMTALGVGLGFGGSLAFWLVKGEGDSSVWGDYRESHLVAGAIGGATGAILGALGSSERWISVGIQRVPQTAAVRGVVTVHVLRFGRRRDPGADRQTSWPAASVSDPSRRTKRDSIKNGLLIGAVSAWSRDIRDGTDLAKEGPAKRTTGRGGFIARHPVLFGALVGAAVGGGAAHAKWGAEGTWVGFWGGAAAGAAVGALVSR